MIRTVVQEPSPVLREKARKVSDFRNPKLAPLIKDMKDTLIEQDGLGLAAPQVNESIAIFVIPSEIAPVIRTVLIPLSLVKPLRPTVFINPQIVSHSKQKEEKNEGCLSVKGFFSALSRSSRVLLRAQDERGRAFSARAEGLLARVFQHETDHLNGILFIDRLHEK